MTKVLYIMGAGRSGSTLLGVMLENCDGVFYGGELDAWPRRHGHPNDDRERVIRFWERVRDRLSERYLEEIDGDLCWRGLEHSSALFRPKTRLAARSQRAAYHHLNRALFDAIAAEADCDIVVDSSHYPLRARELRKGLRGDVIIVFLTRDPHGVVESFQRNARQGAKSVLASNAYIWFTHLISSIVYLTHPRSQRIFVRYEHLLADPAHTLDRVLRVSGGGAAPPAMDALSVGRPFQGNRLLQSTSIKLDADRAGSPRRSLLTTIAQLPWSAAFGLMASRR